MSPAPLTTHCDDTFPDDALPPAQCIYIYTHTGFFKKNSHPLETAEIPCLPPATPNFNVVIGSAEHYQQKWLFFVEGRRAQNSEDNIELGDGGGHDLYGVVLHGMAVFFEEPGMYSPICSMERSKSRNFFGFRLV